MQLTKVRIQRFKNFVDPQEIEIEPDVTGLIGKNESGKTTILTALHRLNPADGQSVPFDLATEYPRWRLARDRREQDLNNVEPVTAWFSLDEDDIGDISTVAEVGLVEGVVCVASRTYSNKLVLKLISSAEDIILLSAEQAEIDPEDMEALTKCGTLVDAKVKAETLEKEQKANKNPRRARSLQSFAVRLEENSYLTGEPLEGELAHEVFTLLPKFFYFSQYDLLPGEVDLTQLAEKSAQSANLKPNERTVVALLARAGSTPSDFTDENYDVRTAELQATSVDISRHVFEYWRQNTDLAVMFKDHMPIVGTDDQGLPVRHRLLRVELRDDRHGGVETNFATRSTGFQWFFSFFAAFGQYQDSDEPLVVLLDEPGMSLHGEAQKDFVRFVFEELGTSKQTLYTTHSQFMIDATRYEKYRAVDDRATRTNPDLSVVVSDVSLAADPETVLPFESAIGYSISQHLFLGRGPHLAVEGSSDFVFLQRMNEFVQGSGTAGLDPQFSIIPVGGDGNMPAFVALLGRRLQVSALVDGARTTQKFEKVVNAAKANGVPESSIVTCAQVGGGIPDTADIEDLFSVEDYLRLYNWAFGSALAPDDLPQTSEPIIRRINMTRGEYDHAIPAHALTDHREEFFSSVDTGTVDRFKKLFELLNATKW